MSIKVLRQSTDATVAAAPPLLSYGQIAVDKDGVIYTGNSSDEVVSKVNYANEALKATQDSAGNPIVSSYAAALDTSGNTIRLKYKNGDVAATITAPYATSAGTATNATGVTGNIKGETISKATNDHYAWRLNYSGTGSYGGARKYFACVHADQADSARASNIVMSYNGNLWISYS